MLNGTRQAHELAEVLATEAVQQTLACVSRDHPLDYTRLVHAYQHDVVNSCCSMFTSVAEDAHCSATTKLGKPCGRRAAVCGVCLQHLDAWQQQQAVQRRQEAYANSLRRDAPADPYARELKHLSAKRHVPMAFPKEFARAL